jgi:hypothetical protein
MHFAPSGLSSAARIEAFPLAFGGLRLTNQKPRSRNTVSFFFYLELHG